jgi:hypothetical protein
MTYTTRCVLYLLFKTGNRSARQVAEFLWPDSEGWSTYHGKRSVRGGGMWLAAGSLMGKLIKQGLVERSITHYPSKGKPRWVNNGYRLTPKGREKLLERVRIRRGYIFG